MVRKKISETVQVPEGIQVSAKDGIVKMKKNSDELEKKFECPMKIDGQKIMISMESPTKKDKRIIKTSAALLKNMINGLEEKYVYKLQICAVHFPMNVSLQGNLMIIKNFLGEVKDRKAKIIPGVEVKIAGEIVTVTSSDKEKAGQTAANIESATKIRNRDRRVFQDGIFITEKQKGARRT